MPAQPAAASAATLLIHCQDPEGADTSVQGLSLHRLRALCMPRSLRRKPGTLKLQILDLQGQQVMALENVGVLTRLSLPAETYHVIASRDRVVRCYTMTLEQRGVSELHLQLAPDSRHGNALPKCQ